MRELSRPTGTSSAGPGDGRLQRWIDVPVPAGLAVTAATLLTGLIAVGDYLTGPYLVFATFYLVPVVAASWFASRAAGLGIAALAAAAGIVSTWLDPEQVAPQVYLWNGVFRFLTYAFVAAVVDAERTAMRTIHALAATDALTGLLNRRRFYELAGRELERARRDGSSIAAVYVDVDDLKQRNDTYGHETGDAMLVTFADAVRATFRTTDLLVRLGGDEFLFLLPGAGLDEASDAVERLRRRLLSTDLLPIRFSAGIRAGPVGAGLDVEAVVHASDVLMLEAKSAGKGGAAARPGLVDATA